ncbi:MAG: tripartite tricarboxylate transporter TctB family protein [Betaproteobacteria bacterium]
MKLSKDGWSGLAVLAASLVLLGFTAGLKDNPLVPIGPGFYPRIVLGLTAALAAALVVFDLFGKRKASAAGEVNHRLVLLVFLIVGLYIGLLPFLGFRLSTLLFVPALQVALEWPKDRRGWLTVAITAAVTTVVAYVLFERYLQVLLPRGRWTGF